MESNFSWSLIFSDLQTSHLREDVVKEGDPVGEGVRVVRDLEARAVERLLRGGLAPRVEHLGERDRLVVPQDGQLAQGQER